MELDDAGWPQLWWGKAMIPHSHAAVWLVFFFEEFIRWSS